MFERQMGDIEIFGFNAVKWRASGVSRALDVL